MSKSMNFLLDDWHYLSKSQPKIEEKNQLDIILKNDVQIVLLQKTTDNIFDVFEKNHFRENKSTS